MGELITLSTKSKAVTALEQAKLKLFVEAETLARRQTQLLDEFNVRLRELSEEHKAILVRMIALEDTQDKLLRPL